MKSDVEQRADGPFQIRAGIWFTVLALGLLCVLTIHLFREESDRHETKMESSPMPATLQGRPLVRPSISQSASSDPAATLTPEEARVLARAIANQKAKELYDCEPFGNGPPAQFVDGDWLWFDRRGQGPADIEATVQLAGDGSIRSVDVILLDLRGFHFLW
jgi:hypothetical protein